MEKPLSTRGTVRAGRKVDKEIGSTSELDSIQFKDLVHMIFEGNWPYYTVLTGSFGVDLRCLPLQRNLQYSTVRYKNGNGVRDWEYLHRRPPVPHHHHCYTG